MFYEISKFLNFFLSPITWIFLLLLVRIFLKDRRKVKSACLWLSGIIFLFFTNELLIDYIRSEMAGEYRKSSAQKEGGYHAAIVMGGFGSMNRETGQLLYGADRGDRLWEAVRLYKNGIVKYILITGDASSSLWADGSSTAELFLIYMEQMGVPRKVFLLEQNARNTRENAVYAVDMLSKRNIACNDCLLITSATHMKRSLGCFARVGVYPDYFSVNIYNSPPVITHRSFYPSWVAAVKWQEILNEWIGICVYRIKGYI